MKDPIKCKITIKYRFGKGSFKINTDSETIKDEVLNDIENHLADAAEQLFYKLNNEMSEKEILK